MNQPLPEWEWLRAIAETEVAQTIKALPAQIRQEANAIPILFETVPSPDLVADGLEPDVLGLFVGGDHNTELDDPLPPQIILYLENLWLMISDEGGGEAEYRFEVRTTLLHELGHYLGLDEEDLTDRGLE
ncbi:MAG: metallopeptidase family protein [Verrucomicrobiota bacterium]